jgi:hypothetical protein
MLRTGLSGVQNLMKLELLQSGSNSVRTSDKKDALTKKKNIWRGKFDRRKYPRDEEQLIEPPRAAGSNNR